MEDAKNLLMYVKWNNKEFKISVVNKECTTVGQLQETISKVTGVRSERQKLINVKTKNGLRADASCKLEDTTLKTGFKIMMVGSLEEDILRVCAPPLELNDTEYDSDTEKPIITLKNNPINVSKVDRRIRDYKIKMLNPPRPGYRLLVLDVDYTMFDHRSVGHNGTDLTRPYLHEFLSVAYQHYDIVIWSATAMKWIEEKMKAIGVADNPNYRIMFYLDQHAMISVQSQRYGYVEVKPLDVIWGKFSFYSEKNTIMIDDMRRNFLMNPKNGIRIRPFKRAFYARHYDSELYKLTKYVTAVLKYDDYTKIDMHYWRHYLREVEGIDFKREKLPDRPRSDDENA